MFRASRAFARPASQVARPQSRVPQTTPRTFTTTAPTAPRLGLSSTNRGATTTWRSGSVLLKSQAIRLASSSSKDDVEAHKQKVIEEALQPRPSEVSTTSSTRKTIETSSSPGSPEPNMTADLKHDLNTVKETFSLDKVPRESHILGLAGTLPYLATSVSTLFLAWDLSWPWPTGSRFFDMIYVEHDTAAWLLGIIEPVQLGYGAIIISFLGAIHWGLEYAEKTANVGRTRFRYGMGVAAPVVAWPTLLMPIEYALTTQFAAFVALYFADARAHRRGWVPGWYGTYRFLLTAMVGLAIFVSLVGRTKMSQHGRLTSEGIRKNLGKEGIADHETDWAKVEAEEVKRLKKEKEEAKSKAKEENKAKKSAKKGEKKQAEEKDKAKDGESKGADKKDGNKDTKEKDEEKDEENKEDQEKDEGKDKDEGEEKDKKEKKD